MRTSNARDTARLWIDADTGAFSTDGAAWFEPGLPLVAFLDRAGHLGLRRLGNQAPNLTGFAWPPWTSGALTAWCVLSFVDGVAEGFHIRFGSTRGQDQASAEDDRVLARQAAWLSDEVGCPPGQYPWGLVWNRFNRDGGFHDVSITYLSAS